MKKVLILCTGNSCRSQMAEYLWNQLGGDGWSASSAGTNPAGYVHPMAITVMNELGIDLTNAQSQHSDDFLDENFDLIVTVCDNAKQTCPVFPSDTTTLHWPFEDPAHAEGDDPQRLAEFRRIRDEIATAIKAYLSTS